MPVTLPIPPPPAEPRGPFIKRFTRDECRFLEQHGLVDPEGYELIQGVLVAKMSKNQPHNRVLSHINLWLVRIFGERVAVEPGIDVSPEDTPTSHPEPDMVVLTHPIDEIPGAIRPSDISMIAEVSDASLTFDLDDKARLYARAAIPEYWVLDVRNQRIIVHRNPGSGVYQSITAYSGDETIATLAAPDNTIPVRDLIY
ncbi:MAG: Uma2 family endonuclease [Acidobacteria bacterium]|nr:Uma2 family endonuclease [Acidobacteriota bacterium]